MTNKQQQPLECGLQVPGLRQAHKYVTGLNRLVSSQPSTYQGKWCTNLTTATQF